MGEKKHKYVGLIGKEPCHQVLEDMLFRLDSPKIAALSLKRIESIRTGLNRLLRGLKDEPLNFQRSMTNIFIKHVLDGWDSVEGQIPENIFTYTKNCLILERRKTVRRLGVNDHPHRFEANSNCPCGNTDKHIHYYLKE